MIKTEQADHSLLKQVESIVKQSDSRIDEMSAEQAASFDFVVHRSTGIKVGIVVTSEVTPTIFERMAPALLRESSRTGLWEGWLVTPNRPQDTANVQRGEGNVSRWLSIDEFQTVIAFNELPLAVSPRSKATRVKHQPISMGGRLHLNRDAGDHETTLGVNAYAKALMKVISSADDHDFCLAVFGPWGRGKTFLLKKVAQLLARLQSPAYDNIQFSAWRYQTRPDVWIHLYTTFFHKLMSRGWPRSMFYIILGGIQRHGTSKIWLAWIGLMISASPKEWLFKGAIEHLAALETTFAIASIVFATVFATKLWQTSSQLKSQYLSTPQHTDKLGLQSTVGLDLKALIMGWIKVDKKDRSIFLGLVALTLCVTSLSCLILLRDGNTLGWIITSAIIVCYLLILTSYFIAAQSPSRLLLIVDDLDRCAPDHLLAVVESIKLLLEDEEIGKRVQVAMLVEEGIIRHSIWIKYKYLFDQSATEYIGSSYNPERILSDNFDKLFTTHIRLEPLSDSDIEAVVNAFGGDDRFELPTIPVDPINQANEPNPTDVPNNPPKDRTHPFNRTISYAPYHFDDIIAINTHEKKFMIRAIKRSFGDSSSNLGPRALRSLLFRYQLARVLLLELNETNWRPEYLADLIVGLYKDKNYKIETSDYMTELLIRVARQVA